MQLCQKETLKHWLVNNVGAKRPCKPELLRMFSSVVDAVAYIHSEGLIHRDLKVRLSNR
jgi:serine/threonine protein kinase